MGNVILPTGVSVQCDSIEGSVLLGNLICDLSDSSNTVTYKLSLIHVLKSLGKVAKDALSSLKELEKHINSSDYQQKCLAEESRSAIKLIEDTKSKTQTWTNHNNHSEESIYAKKIEIQKIDFQEIDDEIPKTYHKCFFCGKFSSSKKVKYFSKCLSNKFHCNFCLGNNYNEINKDIMILTYRGIIGYYYYSYFIAPKTSSMYSTDIDDYIKRHHTIGINNPTFKYDHETMCWFIDFSKISDNKIPISEVLKTVISQIFCFDLLECVPGCNPRKLYDKYYHAIMEFYTKRTRVDGEKIFSPTLINCDIPTETNFSPIPKEMLENFLPSQLDFTYNNRKYLYRW